MQWPPLHLQALAGQNAVWQTLDWQALALTLRLAATTTAVLLLVAIPLAWWIAAGQVAGGSSGPPVGRGLVQALVALPLVLPPTVIGFYLLVGLGPLTRAGQLVSRMLGHPLAFSFPGLLAGSCVYSLPFAVQPLVAGFRGVDRRYGEAAATLGSGPLERFLRVTLPLARPALLAAGVLTFTHTVGEFGVVLMVGGNIPGVTRTASISLFDLVENGHYREANQLSLLLVLLSTVALLAIYLRRGERLA